MSSNEFPSLVVAIATHGRASLLDRTLESLERARLPGSLSRVIIAQNGPPDPHVADVVARHVGRLPLTVHQHPEANKSAALNAVLASFTNELVVFFDDDVRVDAGVLEAYDAAARRYVDGGTVFFGGPVGIDYEEPPSDWLRAYLPPSAAGWRWREPGVEVHRPAFLGINWAARAQDLHAVGGFDPNVGPGAASGATGQESNMQRRLLQAGARGIYLEDALVWHYVPRERCSTDWVLRRAVRMATSDALKAPASSRGRLFGVPPWMVRSLGVGAMSAMRAQFSTESSVRFAGRYRLAVAYGQFKGARLADRLMRQQATSTPQVRGQGQDSHT